MTRRSSDPESAIDRRDGHRLVGRRGYLPAVARRELVTVWDVGIIIWCAFGALVAYALLANLAQLLWDVGEAALDALRRRRRHHTHPPPNAGSEVEVDDLPWSDAFTQRFSGEDDLQTPSTWEPPAPPDGAMCAICGGPLLYVAYGFPGGEMIELAQQGRILIGGCIPGGPRWQCPDPHGTGAGNVFPWNNRPTSSHDGEPSDRAAAPATVADQR